MWNKALLYREYQQLGIRLWIIPILHFLVYGFQRLNDWIWNEPERIERRLSYVTNTMEAMDSGALENLGRMLLVLFAMLLSLIFLSGERRNGTQELLFSLPYSRTQIYFAKWMFGACILTGSLLLNTIIDMAVVLSSPIADYFSFGYYAEQWIYTWIVVMGIYALSMFIGTISGSLTSHAVLLLIIWVLPWYLFEMIWYWADTHGLYWDYGLHREFMRIMDLAAHVASMRYNDQAAFTYVLFAVMLIIFTIAGFYMYSRNRAENNGKLMVSGAWQMVLEVGFVVCFALLSGTISAGILQGGLLAYYFGLIIGVALGTWIIRSLTKLRLKI